MCSVDFPFNLVPEFHCWSLIDRSRILPISFFFKKVFCFILFRVRMHIYTVERVSLDYWRFNWHSLSFTFSKFFPCLKTRADPSARRAFAGPCRWPAPAPSLTPAWLHPYFVSITTCCLTLQSSVDRSYFHLITCR